MSLGDVLLFPALGGSAQKYCPHLIPFKSANKTCGGRSKTMKKVQKVKEKSRKRN